MRKIDFVIISITMVIILACSSSTEPEDILVLSDSFERFGSPTYIGWQITPDSVDFDGDTPVEGSVHSILLRPGNDMEGSAEKFLDNEHGSGEYKFSVWAKMSSNQPDSTGYVQFGVFSGDIVTQLNTIVLTESEWEQLEITENLTLGSEDQLYIKLSCGAGQTGDTWYSLFDEVKIWKLAD